MIHYNSPGKIKIDPTGDNHRQRDRCADNAERIHDMFFPLPNNPFERNNTLLRENMHLQFYLPRDRFGDNVQIVPQPFYKHRHQINLGQIGNPSVLEYDLAEQKEWGGVQRDRKQEEG